MNANVLLFTKIILKMRNCIKLIILGFIWNTWSHEHSYAQFGNSFLDSTELNSLIEELKTKQLDVDLTFTHNENELAFIYKIVLSRFYSHLENVNAYKTFHYLFAKKELNNYSCFDSVSFYFKPPNLQYYYLNLYLPNSSQKNSFHDVFFTDVMKGNMSYFSIIEPNKSIKSEEIIYFLNHYNYNDHVTLIQTELGYFIIENDILYSINNGEKIKASDYFRKYNWEFIDSIFHPKPIVQSNEYITCCDIDSRLDIRTKEEKKAVSLMENFNNKNR